MGERPADLGGPRQRALLARLVLAGGEVVSTDRLIEDLWAGDPPPKALGALQAHISYLRRAVEPARPPRAPATVLVSEAPGYALRLDPAAVDAWRFERLLAAGDPDDHARRYQRLGTALACWHGEPYAPFATAHWVLAEAARLHELRRVAVEGRAESALALGRPDEAFALLHRHVTDHPDRENAARLLALAQYRLGRQLDALATLRALRTYLDTEFGVRPSPALNALETAFLSHAPELDQRVGSDRADDAAPFPDRVETGVPGQPVPRSDKEADTALETVAEPTPVVGYASERAALVAETAEVVVHKRARVVWLEGEAGAGKSTQVDVLAGELAADGWTVASASCPEVDGAPAAWAWVQLLDALDPAWLSAMGDESARTAVQAGPFAIARAVAEVCGRRLDDGPLLVVLEDVHRADSATLQILRQVVAWLSRRPLLVLVTARGSETDAGVRATAAALAGSTGLRLELGGLDATAVRAVAERAGLTSLDDDTVEWLRARTAGNPLFVREVATLAAAVGDLHAVPEGVRAVLHRRIARLPAGAARALRLAAVWGDDIDFDTLLALTAEPEDTLIDLVDTVTVAGLVRVDTDRITFAHALIRDAVYGDIPTLRRARLHWSALEFLESRIFPTRPPFHPRADHAHGAADPGLDSGPMPVGAESTTDLAAVDTVVLDAMAHHAIAGAATSTADRALRYVLAAARRRTARRAHQDAEPLWRAALELHARAGHDSPTATRPDRLSALATRCALINALAYGGNDDQARRLRAESLTIARALMPADNTARPSEGAAAGDGVRASHDSQADGDAARAGHRESATADVPWTGHGGLADGGDHSGLGRSAVPEAGQVSTVDSRIDTDPVVAVLTCWRAPTIWTSRDRGLPDSDMAADLAAALDRTTASDLRVRLLVTIVFAVEGFDNPRAFACSAEALRIARELGDPELLCAALNARAFVALGPDLWSERAGLTDELLRVATAAGLPEYQAVAHFLRFLVASGAGRLVDARSEIAEALDCAEGGQLGPLLVVATAHLAVLAVLRGDLTTAEAIDTDLSAKMIAAGNANGAQLVLLAQMMTGWARGDLTPGLDGYAQLYAAAPHAISYVYALALLDAGDTERAATVLDAGTEVLRDYYWGAMTAFEARVVARIGTAEAAERLYRDLLPRTGTIAGMDSGSVAFGPVDTVLAELAERLGDHAAAARHRAAVERVLADLATELAALDETGAPLH
ncbi:BTAD domain-containing putative transcriptional regulator [Nocardia neocaledoniensis]|uniref:BTAD domain-containing putative transcriptional regulator n=1 Tax=Nocardia neocaledoniensis TaxID=236511 RepID=UPI002458ADAF|nr:BTAD domain-containing putative transcriptional regulator [Nocardia neocaledoniensis]